MSDSQKRFWFIAYPDIARPIGGIKQIHKCAELIRQLGHYSCLVQDKTDFHPTWFHSSVNTISKKSWYSLDLKPYLDYIVLPETFVVAIPDLFPSIPKIIFNQNGSYSFGLSSKTLYKPSVVVQLYSHPDVHQIWCVSDFDYNLLIKGFDLDVDRVYKLVNGIEPLFYQDHLRNKSRYLLCREKINLIVHLLLTVFLA